MYVFRTFLLGLGLSLKKRVSLDYVFIAEYAILIANERSLFLLDVSYLI